MGADRRRHPRRRSLSFIPASQARIQAALTPPSARGSADVINLFRLSIGGVIGSVVTLWVVDPAIIVTASGVICLATAAAIWLIAPQVPGSRAHARGNHGTSERAPSALRQVLRSRSPLRSVIVVDLCLYFIIPTQLVNLLLVDRAITEQAGILLAFGMVGVLIGRGWPAFIGQPRTLRAALVVAIAVGAVILAVSAWLMVGDWLLHQPVPFALLIISGSAVVAYIQCLLAAAVRQQVPDDVRGRLSGAIWAARLVLVAVSVAGSAYLVERGDSLLYLAVLASAFTLLLVVSGGLRSLRA